MEAVGGNVTRFQLGDEVIGASGSANGFGAFAEYVSVPEHILVQKPSTFSSEEAASVPIAAITALQGLRDKGHIQSGQNVLINGASGGVGTFAVHIAQSFGAEVTAVCSTNNLDTARLIGADETIDYTKEDFTKNGQRYDLILEVAARHSISDYKRALPPEGRYVLIGGSMVVMFQIMLFGALTSRREGKAMDFLMANATKQDLEFVRGLLESGEVKPVIDRHYTLDEVPGAIAYLEEGHAKGKVVVTLKRS